MYDNNMTECFLHGCINYQTFDKPADRFYLVYLLLMSRFKSIAKALCWSIILTALSGAGTGALAQSLNFSKLVVFGDSLSDTGNIAVIDLPPPYFRNRISDGPVAVDFIANSIGSNADSSRHFFGSPRGFNYAVSGGNILGSDREDLEQQVSTHLQRVNQSTDENALYVIIMGGNDLRDIRSITDSGIAAQRINAVASQLDAQINRLVEAGATSFLIANVPNIGRIPETLQRQSSDPTISSRAESYVGSYNSAFARVVDKYRQRSDLAVSSFDLFQALENILNNASDLGFRNIEEGCFNPGDFPFSFDSPPIELDCIIFGFESRVFFDNIHPSSRTNELLAPRFIEAIPSFSVNGTNRTTAVPAIIQLLLEN